MDAPQAERSATASTSAERRPSLITMCAEPIQTARLPADPVDMVFTSPPYFDMERYMGLGEVKERTEGEWVAAFLKPALDRSVAHLVVGGHLVIVINQRHNQTYLFDMHDYLAEMACLEYLGVISYTDAKVRNPQPVWIWVKVSATNHTAAPAPASASAFGRRPPESAPAPAPAGAPAPAPAGAPAPAAAPRPRQVFSRPRHRATSGAACSAASGRS